MKNKRGISVIIGYVLLIVIAIGLSITVFGFLKAYLPKDTPECETDVKLIIKDKSCDFSKKTLSLTLENRGLFSADAAFIRFAKSDRRVRRWVNNYEENSELSYVSDFLFCPSGTPEYIQDLCELKPGEAHDFTLPMAFSSRDTPGEYTIEVQPAVFAEDEQVPIVCEQAVITQKITC